MRRWTRNGRLRGVALALWACVLCAAAATPGARVPWDTHEAEDAATTGTVLGPDFAGQTAAREASGRRCVRLDAVGQYVEFTARTRADGLVVRYSIPDSADGRGRDATLSLYVNGRFRTKLPMTSRYSHLYGDYPFHNNPASGTPRNFWDELRCLPGALEPDDVLRLQRDRDDAAPEYLVDLVDLEPVPPAGSCPEAWVSVIDCGAVSGDEEDDRDAFVTAIGAAQAKGVGVWIPPGRFVLRGPIEVRDIALRGAGMWHTTLVGVEDYTPEHRVAFIGVGSNVLLEDFAVIGKLTYRHDYEPNDGIGGSFGTGSMVRGVWVEHTKVGAWVVNSDGLLVDRCRFRNTLADGINLSVGMRHAVVRETTTRGTGDDGFAIWPATYLASTGVPGSNRIVRCTAQLPFLAQGFSIYGGADNVVEDCAALDIPYGAGAFASTTFPTEFGFQGRTIFRRMRIVRAGDHDGAIGTVANALDLPGLRVEDVEVVDSPRDGLKFTSYHGRALREAEFDRIRIVRAGACGILENDGAVGSARLSRVAIVEPGSAAWLDRAPAFELHRGEGNEGWGGEPDR